MKATRGRYVGGGGSIYICTLRQPGKWLHASHSESHAAVPASGKAPYASWYCQQVAPGNGRNDQLSMGLLDSKQSVTALWYVLCGLHDPSCLRQRPTPAKWLLTSGAISTTVCKSCFWMTV